MSKRHLCGFWSLSLGLSVTQFDLAHSDWYPAGQREVTPVQDPGHLAFALRATVLTTALPPSVTALSLKGTRPGRDSCHTTTLSPKTGRCAPRLGHLSLPLTTPRASLSLRANCPRHLHGKPASLLVPLSDLKPGLTPQLTGATTLLLALRHHPLGSQ